MSAFARRKALLEQEKSTSMSASEDNTQAPATPKYNGMGSAQNSSRSSTSLLVRSKFQRTPVVDSTDGGSASNSGFNTDSEIVGDIETLSENLDLDMQDARRFGNDLALWLACADYAQLQTFKYLRLYRMNKIVLKVVPLKMRRRD